MYIELLNESIYYFLENDNQKPLVVYIHGLGGKADFFEQYSKFTNRNYRILAFDLIGRGNTKTNQNLSIDLWLENIHAVLNALNIKEFYLLSHSLGAYLASEIINSKKYNILNSVFVAPFNCFVNKDSQFLQKIKSIYSNRNLNDLQILKDQYEEINKEIASTLLINSYEDYVYNCQLLTTLIDINFYNKKMLKAFRKLVPTNFIVAKNDSVVNLESIKELCLLNKPLSCEIIDGEHNIIVTQKEFINEYLNKIVK